MSYLTWATATGIVNTSLEIRLYACRTFRNIAASRHRLFPETPACFTITYRTVNPQTATCPTHQKHNLGFVDGPSVKTRFYSAFLMVMSGAGNGVRTVCCSRPNSVSLCHSFFQLVGPQICQELFLETAVRLLFPASKIVSNERCSDEFPVANDRKLAVL